MCRAGTVATVRRLGFFTCFATIVVDVGVVVVTVAVVDMIVPAAAPR